MDGDLLPPAILPQLRQQSTSRRGAERGRNAIDWKNIGIIGTTVNSSYTDTEPFDISHYPIKRTDLDSSSKYLKNIVVNHYRINLTELAIYPNPSKGMFNLDFTGEKTRFNPPQCIMLQV